MKGTTERVAKVGDTVYSTEYSSNNLTWAKGVVKKVYLYGDTGIDLYEYLILTDTGKEIMEYHYNIRNN